MKETQKRAQQLCKINSAYKKSQVIPEGLVEASDSGSDGSDLQDQDNISSNILSNDDNL